MDQVSVRSPPGNPHSPCNCKWYDSRLLLYFSRRKLLMILTFYPSSAPLAIVGPFRCTRTYIKRASSFDRQLFLGWSSTLGQPYAVTCTANLTVLGSLEFDGPKGQNSLRYGPRRTTSSPSSVLIFSAQTQSHLPDAGIAMNLEFTKDALLAIFRLVIHSRKTGLLPSTCDDTWQESATRA